MRAFDPQLKDHLDGAVTTTCTCWIVRRSDGVVLGFTDHDRNLSIEGVACEAASGFRPTAAVSELGLSSDNQDIEGAFSSVSIASKDVNAGLYDGARVDVWLVNWAQPDQRHHMRTAIIGEVTQEDESFRAELRGLTSLLEQKLGRTYSRRCDAVLGDGRCGVDLSSSVFHGSGAVSQVKGRLDFTCSGLTAFPSGWFTHGNLTWTSGDNIGLSVELAASNGANTQLTLWKALPHLPQIGDAFHVTAGCDKSFTICKAKFGNHLNFRGFPHMPGSDFALGYADDATVHDGRPLID
ncbi:MAG: DUF2163 domain-containing protein [Ahrensia sp.]|nr:DUF2163 domain-containing protein [Ahrensia sp.]